MILTLCSFTVYQGDCIENDDVYGGVGFFKFKILRMRLRVDMVLFVIDATSPSGPGPPHSPGL